MVAFSSRLGLKDLLSDIERHAGQRHRIYDAIKLWPGAVGPSREDLSKACGMRLGSVCGRVSELLRDGVIAKGPMKTQEVVPGHPVPVETLQALVYQEPKANAGGQLHLF